MILQLTDYLQTTALAEVPLSHEGEDWNGGDGYTYLLTAKRKLTDPDTAAVFQLADGAGISVLADEAELTLLAEATLGKAIGNFYVDIRATHKTTGNSFIIAEFRWNFLQPVGRFSASSVPIYTINPQPPGTIDNHLNGTDPTHALASPQGKVLDDKITAEAAARAGADATKLAKESNLSDLNNAATARGNLGLGNVENTALSTGQAGTVANIGNLTGDVTSVNRVTTLATVPLTKGGTGGTTPAAARENLKTGNILRTTVSGSSEQLTTAKSLDVGERYYTNAGAVGAQFDAANCGLGDTFLLTQGSTGVVTPAGYAGTTLTVSVVGDSLATSVTTEGVGTQLRCRVTALGAGTMTIEVERIGMLDRYNLPPRLGLSISDNSMGIVLGNSRVIGTGSSAGAGSGAVTGMASVRKATFLATGTTATGHAQIIERAVGGLAHFVPGGSTMELEYVLGVPVVSDGTDSYELRIGMESNNFGTINDGIFFRYNHSVNTGKWQAISRRSGVETATDTGVTVVAGTWNRLRISINSAGTSIGYYIDGALVATHTTNIPVSCGYTCGINKLLGTTSRTLYVNSFRLSQRYNTPLY